jgi:hypothetical protein
VTGCPRYNSWKIDTTTVSSKPSAERLVRFLKREAGEYLRGALLYDDDGYEMLYLRNDLQRVRLRSEVDTIVSRLREGSKASEEETFPFGEFHGSVRCFEDATLLHFPMNGGGVAVSLDPGAARNLNTFAGECLEQIHANPPV